MLESSVFTHCTLHRIVVVVIVVDVVVVVVVVTDSTQDNSKKNVHTGFEQCHLLVGIQNKNKS